MVNIILREKVEDFEKWKTIFEEYDSARKEAGRQSVEIFRNGEDTSDVTVLLNWDNIENFQKFGQSEVIKEAMQKMAKAMDVGKPIFYFSN